MKLHYLDIFLYQNNWRGFILVDKRDSYINGIPCSLLCAVLQKDLHPKARNFQWGDQASNSSHKCIET